MRSVIGCSVLPVPTLKLTCSRLRIGDPAPKNRNRNPLAERWQRGQPSLFPSILAKVPKLNRERALSRAETRRFRALADAGCHLELRQMADLRANEHIVGDVPIASVLSASTQGQ